MILESVLKQISYLQFIDTFSLARMRGEVLSTQLVWQEEYSEYQSGGWQTLSLMNKTGRSEDVLIDDGAATPTEALQQLPSIAEFLKELNLSYMWVRLANMKPGSCLWEHVDYAELASRPRLRLHLPLTEEKNAFLIIRGFKIHMSFGYLWKLDPRTNHAAVNFGVRDRIHMIMDCYIDDNLAKLISGEMLRDDLVVPLPKLQDIPSMMPPGLDAQQKEDWLKRLFFSFNLGEETTYSLLTKHFEDSGDLQRATHWRELGTRFISQPM